MIDLDLFFDILRDVARATDFVQKWGKIAYPHALIALAFRNGMGYRYDNGRVNSANEACISCESFVKFGPVTPELTGIICERLV